MVAGALCLPVLALSACQSTEEPLGAPSASPAQTLIKPHAKKAEKAKPSNKPQKMVHSVVKGGAKGGPSKALLDSYAAQAQTQFESMYGDALKKLFMDITIKPQYPNGLEIVYVYKQAVSPAAARAQIEQGAPVLKQTFESIMAPELKAHGLVNPTATFTYENPDGTVIWSRTFG
jgi:hypothetical protein